MTPRKIICADDTRVLRMIYETVLGGKTGFVVDLVEDGDLLVERVRAERYSCVITDYLMPRMDGIKAAQEIRTFNSDIPIVLVSGNPEIESKAYDSGVNGFLYKPFKPTDLISLVNESIKK